MDIYEFRLIFLDHITYTEFEISYILMNKWIECYSRENIVYPGFTES